MNITQLFLTGRSIQTIPELLEATNETCKAISWSQKWPIFHTSPALVELYKAGAAPP